MPNFFALLIILPSASWLKIIEVILAPESTPINDSFLGVVRKVLLISDRVYVLWNGLAYLNVNGEVQFSLEASADILG